MRPRPFILLVLLLISGASHAQGERRYEIVKDSVRVSKAYARDNQETGKSEIVIDVSFRLEVLQEGPAADDRDEIVITEGGREVHRIPLKQVRLRRLTTVLAMDVSGSMARPSSTGKSKMEEAQSAALVFLDRLPSLTNTGLVLFDHRVLPANRRYPSEDAADAPADRREVARMIQSAKPDGGTAYLDATHQALVMLSKFHGERAVVLMTDGIDLNSKKTAPKVVEYANEVRIPVHVIGIGDPGWSEPVTSVLVLDHSASMAAKAGDDRKTKMEALHEAAGRFVDLMRDGAKSTLLPFSSQVERPGEFTSDKRLLKDRIRRLTPSGGTSLFDAAHAGVEAVVATRPKGKRYVVVLTDGVDEDPGSRHDADDVIRLAKDEGVPVYMLGLGRKEDINEDVMRKIARATGGRYERADNQEELYRVFEQLSIDIHGDGIDEDALRALAKQTDGRYYRAKDASELKLLYTEVAGELQSSYTVTFRSTRQVMDALPSAIDIFVRDREGRRVSNRGEGDSFRGGLVVAMRDYLVYLLVLAGLVGLLALPSAMKRRQTV